MRRDAGIDDRDADALPVHSRNAEQPGQQRVSGARLIRRRRRVRDHRRAAHGQIAGQMVDGPVTRQIAQFGAVREHHGGAAHPLDDAAAGDARPANRARDPSRAR